MPTCYPKFTCFPRRILKILSIFGRQDHFGRLGSRIGNWCCHRYIDSETGGVWLQVSWPFWLSYTISWPSNSSYNSFHKYIIVFCGQGSKWLVLISPVWDMGSNQVMLQKSSQLPKMKRIFEIPWGKLEILDIRRSFFTLVTLLYNSCGYIWWGCRTLFWHEKFTFILYHYRSPTWDFKKIFFVDSWDDFGSIVRRIVAGPFFCYPTIMALNKNTSISTNYVPNLMVSFVRF